MNLKLLVLCLFTFLSTSSFAGFSLNCGIEPVDWNDDLVIGESSHLVIIDYAHFPCKGMGKLKGKRYLLEFGGFGPGLRWDYRDRLILTCPTIRKEKMFKQQMGVKISAGAGVGATLAMTFNKNLGTCFLSGVGIMAGAGASLGWMAIHEGGN